MDLPAREEELDKRLNAAMKQLCLVPAYVLTTHKSQSLSIKQWLIGSLEGIFALRQTYGRWIFRDGKDIHRIIHGSNLAVYASMRRLFSNGEVHWSVWKKFISQAIAS